MTHKFKMECSCGRPSAKKLTNSLATALHIPNMKKCLSCQQRFHKSCQSFGGKYVNWKLIHLIFI